MKKLMMAAAIVCAAVMAHAGAYNWNASAGWISPDDENGWSGNSVYFFSANEIAKASLLSNLTMDRINEYAMYLDSGENYVATGADGDFSIAGEANSFTAGEKGTTANLYALLLADAGGKTYAYAIDASEGVVISDAVVAGQQMAFSFADTVTGAAGTSGWTEVVSVPEPTSGLLLLLGMAGLALRRRRA